MSNPTPNDLGRVITNAPARAAVYGAYVVALIIAGAATVGFATLDVGIPDWLAVTNAVLTYLGIPVGGLALANILPKAAAEDTSSAQPDSYESDVAPVNADYASVNPANE